MSLTDLFKPEHVVISCELFPPKTDKGVRNLIDNVRRLMAFSPEFVTCTYGAGGSSQNKTLDILQRVKTEFNVPVASHLTLVGSTQDDLRSYLSRARDIEVDYIVALRGDPPQGQDHFEICEGGLGYANELVDLIKSEFGNFGIAVAGYPEVHQEAPDAKTDLDNLKRKVDAGADIIITQLFFDNRDF
ncbi:MAG: methylenetetrahydrofolate reductase, partial [Planctomycetota bacterium]